MAPTYGELVKLEGLSLEALRAEARAASYMTVQLIRGTSNLSKRSWPSKSESAWIDGPDVSDQL